MQRLKQMTLLKWLDDPKRKPLILRGARQVGKTWLIRQLATDAKRHLIELNFERNPRYVDFFANNDPSEIILQLESHFNQTISPQNSLLFLDEIQEAPQLLAKLRWFAEELPQLPVIAAGSLLDFALQEHSFSMPVGRVQYSYIEPMSFEEFVLAKGHQKLFEFLKNWKMDDRISDPVHDQLLALLREYFFVGGMPEAVKIWITSKSLQQVGEIHLNLLSSFRDDFAKYSGRISRERLDDILNSVPQQLGMKFQYKRANADVQASPLKKSLELLCMARVCHKVQDTDANGLPLSANQKERIFKVILLDIGLVSSLLGLTLHDKALTDELRLVNEGGLAEQFVGQTLRTKDPIYIDPCLYYWLRDKKTSTAEIDYVIQHTSHIVPIEVKAGSTGTLRSLHIFMSLKQLSTAIRINADKPSVVQINMQSAIDKPAKYQLISLPFYLLGQVERILQSQEK